MVSKSNIIKLNFIKRGYEFGDLAFDPAAVVEFEEWA